MYLEDDDIFKRIDPTHLENEKQKCELKLVYLGLAPPTFINIILILLDLRSISNWLYITLITFLITLWVIQATVIFRALSKYYDATRYYQERTLIPIPGGPIVFYFYLILVIINIFTILLA